MSVELKAAERLENLRKQHGGICTPYACDICWLLQQLDDAPERITASKILEREHYDGMAQAGIDNLIERVIDSCLRHRGKVLRRQLWIRFMWGVLVGSAVTAIILVSQVWWLDIGRHLF